MKIHTSYHRNEPNTIEGESVTFIQKYSSYDKREIDFIQSQLQLQYGSGTIADVDVTGFLEEEQEE